jgi:hypothetical protein
MATQPKRIRLSDYDAMAKVTSAIHDPDDWVSTEVAVIQLMEKYDFDLAALKVSLIGMTLFQLF